MPNNDKMTILIVDDEEDVLRPIAYRLEVQGFNVLREADGERGFQTAVAKLPDLILLDIMMPGMDGLTLCDMLKEREDTGEIPIIIVTAKTMVGDVQKAFESGADDYVSKPFEWDELCSKINLCLAHRAMAGSFSTGRLPGGPSRSAASLGLQPESSYKGSASALSGDLHATAGSCKRSRKTPQRLRPLAGWEGHLTHRGC